MEIRKKQNISLEIAFLKIYPTINTYIMSESPLIYIPNKKFQEIDTNLTTEKFVLKSKQCAEKLIQWEIIYFSDIVTQFAGLSQLIYEPEWYCFGEDYGDSTPLNEKQIIRLEYAILSVLEKIILKIREQTPELWFTLHRKHDPDEMSEMLQLTRNESISEGIRTNIFSLLEWQTKYL